ncbi:MAG: calcium/sodium antiporter [Pseudomonadota bacterium]
MMDIALAVAGLALLLFAGDGLVRGAVALSLRLGVPALIVSLTVVAFGTSAPELLISISAALSGSPGLAYGNVVGSNIANVLLVLGVPALITTIDTRSCHSGRNYMMMMFASIVFVALCFQGPLSTPHGMALLVVLALMLADAYRSALIARQANGGGVAVGGGGGGGDDDALSDIDPEDRGMPLPKAGLFILLGLIGLPLGAHLLVEGARNIAVAFGVSDATIGLTLVAVGTSLPELATTLVATLRKQCDVAIGNAIGSNMFNLLAIMGITSFFGPLPVPEGFLTYDLWIMLAASLVLAPFVFHLAPISRFWGATFVLAYVAYTYTVIQH